MKIRRKLFLRDLAERGRVVCPNCRGEGTVMARRGRKVCPVCQGSGRAAGGVVECGSDGSDGKEQQLN